jgi:hypothetical protein
MAEHQQYSFCYKPAWIPWGQLLLFGQVRSSRHRHPPPGWLLVQEDWGMLVVKLVQVRPLPLLA